MDAELHQSILASLPLGICILDPEGLILDANPPVERFLGLTIAELRGQSMASTVMCAVADPAYALWWSVMLAQAVTVGETTYIDLPTEFFTGPGRDQRVSLVGMGAPWIGVAGQRLGTLVLLLERLALSQDRAQRDHFLSVVSHELGVPVTSILAAAEHLSSHVDPADRDASKLVHILLAEANRLRSLLSKLLSQVDKHSRSSAPEERPVPLRPLIRRVVETGCLRQNGRNLVADLPARLPLVYVDPDGVLQVLNKLVDNALKYSPPGTHVVVSALARPSGVLVTVFDAGPALPAAEARQVFRPLYRGTAAQHVPGQGMGLTIARNIVRAAGGELWYEAPAAGGNRFCFTLPTTGHITGKEDDGAQ